MGYNDVILTDANLNRVTSIPIDYYTKDTNVIWKGFVYNSTDLEIVDCRIATSNLYDGVFSISGGGITGFWPATSNWDTTCTIGSVVSGGVVPIILQIFISGGSSLDGLQAASLYISR